MDSSRVNLSVCMRLPSITVAERDTPALLKEKNKDTKTSFLFYESKSPWGIAFNIDRPL